MYSLYVLQLPIQLLLNEYDLYNKPINNPNNEEKHWINRRNNTVTKKQLNRVAVLSVGLSTFNHFFYLRIWNLNYSVQWEKKQLVRTVMSIDRHKSSTDTLFLKRAKCKMCIEMND